MKLSVFLFCCLILLIEYNTVDGGLVGNFFGEVHETAKKVRQDVRGILQLNNSGKNGENSKEVVSTTTTAKVATEASTSTTAASINSEDENTEKPPTKTTTVPSVTETTTSPDTKTTTEKEGRNNFNAPCSVGFHRTLDGGCKPTI